MYTKIDQPCFCNKVAAFQTSSGSKSDFTTNWCFQHAPLYVICPETDQAKRILKFSSYKTLLPKKHTEVFTKVQVTSAERQNMTCDCNKCLVCAISKKDCDFCPCNLNTAHERFLQINGAAFLACRNCLDYRLKEITTIPKYKSKFVFPKYLK